MTSPLIHADETRLTVYSGDFDAVSQSASESRMPGLVLVEQHFSATLENGRQELRFDRLPRALDVGSVELKSAGGQVRIDGQRYDFALLDPVQLLRRSIGKPVRVQQAAGGNSSSFSGTLLAVGDDTLTLGNPDGSVQLLSGYSSFRLERMPEGLATRPALVWPVESGRKASQDFILNYASGGLGWQAEYRIVLDGSQQQGQLSMTAAAQVVNRSGMDFPDAGLTLVAGRPNQVRSAPPAQPTVMMKSMAMTADSATGGGIQAQDSGEYHAYPLPRRVDLPNGSIQQVHLVAPVNGVRQQRRYVIGSANSYSPARPQIHDQSGTENLKARVVLAFENSKDSGLGLPLPAGRVRVFQRENNQEQLLGESRLAHTASGAPVELDLGEAFDVSAERKPTATRLSDDRLSLEETIEVTLRNAKKTAVTVRLHEALSRWRDWEVLEASADWERENAQSIRFDVDLPAGGEKQLRYRVRYRWPANLRP